MKVVAKLVLCAMALTAITSVDARPSVTFRGIDAQDVGKVGQQQQQQQQQQHQQQQQQQQQQLTPKPKPHHKDCDSGFEPAPTPAPTTFAPLPVPSSKAPVPGPSSKAPVPGPSSKAPVPGPSSKAPVPGPSSKAPVPEPSSKAPEPTTPAVTTKAPEPTTPAVTTKAPEPTTPAVTTKAPEPTTPAVTTPAPTTKAPWSLDAVYDRPNVDCHGLIRSWKTKFEDPLCKHDFIYYAGPKDPADVEKNRFFACIKCDKEYDDSFSSAPFHLCGGKPICTRFNQYGEVPAGELLCVIQNNGKDDIEEACHLDDN
ncbi:hypothetical protein P43SY_009026 [Pythium insidiosum]|uniref:Uncharacterized protein n=1 Tax=Pythium insidiosum TaxID=114742 RepID=A0AAD5MDB0_PYTIN|nr:hypothetical protein P43SY_009026 [Pythium insidiosum]